MVETMSFGFISGWLARWTGLFPDRGATASADHPRHTVRLRRHEVLTLAKGSSVQVVQLRNGTVWITGTPGANDVVLEHEEAYRLEKCWPYVIEALTDAEVRLERPSNGPGRP